MHETLEQFRARTNYIWNPLPKEGFAASPRSGDKVSADGRLLPFYGNTTIFDLSQDDIAWLTGMQDALYAACGDILSERLRPETFHITLHDLLNGTDWQALESGVQHTHAHAQQVVRGIRESFPWGIHVRSLCLLNMVGSSVVLVFEPVDEENENYVAIEDEATLQAVYGIFKERFKDVLTFED